MIYSMWDLFIGHSWVFTINRVCVKFWSFQGEGLRTGGMKPAQDKKKINKGKLWTQWGWPNCLELKCQADSVPPLLFRSWAVLFKKWSREVDELEMRAEAWDVCTWVKDKEYLVCLRRETPHSLHQTMSRSISLKEIQSWSAGVERCVSGLPT